jgi:membrane-associated phospholipid phosphatase
VISRGTQPYRSLPPRTLLITALTSLSSFVLLAFTVAHGHGPYGFEDPVFEWLGHPFSALSWTKLAERLTTPSVGAAVVISVVFSITKRALPRVAIYAAFAALAFLVSEHVAKPIVQRIYYGELTFPSGSVTAVSATALGMWLALYPFLGRRGRVVTLLVGSCWTLLTAIAVVGALWHTPLDDLGSVLLSIGVVTVCAAVFEQATTRGARIGGGRSMVKDSG